MKTQPVQNKGERGVTLVVVLVLTGALMTAGMVMFDRVAYTAKESNDRIKEQQAFLMAEAGINKALWWLNTFYKQPTGTLLDVTRAPVRFGGAGAALALPNNHPAANYIACSDGAAQPDAVAGTNGFNAHLGGTQTLGGGSYVVTSLTLITARVDCGGGAPRDRDEMWEIRVTGTYQGISRTATAMLSRPVTITTTPNFGLFAKNKIRLTSNMQTKSFNSKDATYVPNADPSKQGQWVNADGTTNECACNSSIGTNANTKGVVVLESNVRINGAVTPGPGAASSAVTTGSNVVITGSTSPAAAVRDFPPPEAPAGTCCLPLPVAGQAGYSKDVNNNITYTLPPGNYGNVAINSTDRLILLSNQSEGINAGKYSFTKLHLNSNSTLTLDGDASQFKVTVTATSDAFVADSNTRVNAGGKPDKLTVIATANTTATTDDANSGNSTVRLNSNAALFGTIYAPNAKAFFTSDARIYGAAVADRLTAESNVGIFYDVNLANQNTTTVIGDILIPYFSTNL